MYTSDNIMSSVVSWSSPADCHLLLAASVAATTTVSSVAATWGRFLVVISQTHRHCHSGKLQDWTG